MVFGVLKGQRVGMAAIIFMSYQSTIQAPLKLKNAMQMIHMQEGMLLGLVSPQFSTTYL